MNQRAAVLDDKRWHYAQREQRRNEKRVHIETLSDAAEGEPRVCRANMERWYEHWIGYTEYPKQVARLWDQIGTHDETFYDEVTRVTWIGQKRDMVLQAAAERIRRRFHPESIEYREFTTLEEEDD
jgi:hypothetical protein